MNQIVPVILCGGSGTRLWPRSRASHPKPFLPLVGESTLFRATIDRCPASEGFAPPIVVTGSAHLVHVEKQLEEASRGASIIVEPYARNTAAAIALAALRLPPDAIMLVCPSDHHIGVPEAFIAAAHSAVKLAQNGWLVSFGIEATAPETGFGYLKRGEPIDERAFRTAKFVEKPDLERAKAFLAEGIYAWNGGIFAFKVSDFLSELGAHRPDILEGVRQAVTHGVEDEQRFHPNADAFAQVPSESVDYAVMENTNRAAMVPADMAWSDIGNWDALYQAREHDENGNTTRGPVELVDCQDVLVDSDGPTVSVIGLEGVYIVVDGNDILITTAAGAQKVGKLAGAANQ